MRDNNDHPIQCRCGGEPTEPERYQTCPDRWIIRCQVPRCQARNIAQGQDVTIEGWNRLSSSFYR